MEKTNFDHIHASALKLIDMENCPDYVKDDLLKMVADEQSVVHHAHVVATMIITCPAYAELMNRTVNMFTLETLLFLATGKPSWEGKDE